MILNRKKQTAPSQNEIWLQSLGLLFNACEPLTYDCMRTEEEQKELYKNIEHYTHYCAEVKRDIDSGKIPVTFDAWEEIQNEFIQLPTTESNKDFWIDLDDRVSKSNLTPTEFVKRIETITKGTTDAQ